MTPPLGITVTIGESPIGVDVTDLVAVALRRNPRRAHLLVSTVLGKHLGVDPRTVYGCGLLLGQLTNAALQAGPDARLADLVPAEWADAARRTVSGLDPGALMDTLRSPEVPDADTVTAWRGVDGPVVVGFAETATALGHAVADAVGARVYLHSTRRASDTVPAVGTFEEGHSHATTHLLTPLPASLIDGDDPLILVDDEQSTGRTAMATIEALRSVFPTRRRYLIASLVDFRTDDDIDRMQCWATDIGLDVQVVALARGGVGLPDGITEAAAEYIARADRGGPPDGLPDSEQASAAHGKGAAVTEIHPPWSAGLRHGGRFGFAHGSQPAFSRAVDGLAAAVRAALPAAANRILVLGTEELMYLPLRLALRLADQAQVRFQSTTRSPVHAELTPGYPVRRRIDFTAHDGTARYLYNATFPPADGSIPDGAGLPEADVIVLVVDDRPGTVVEAVAALGIPVIAVHLPEEQPEQSALGGSDFGSYPAADVQWLLTDLSQVDLEAEVADRERRIQGGQEHYAQSLPIEYQPGADYQRLFAAVLAESAPRLATAVGLLTELVLAERARPPVLVSLARAGTPVGLLMRRWAARKGLDLPHYAVSIVRDKGIDPVALQYLSRRHDPADVLFVDGWTGKGAIAVELRDALAQVREAGGPGFDPTIAVLADPGSCTTLFGTRDDFLIASACLNSTVSGLVSRTVLNTEYTSPQQFHGAKFYADLAADDVSMTFIHAVADQFDAVAAQVDRQLPALRAADRTPTFAGWRAIEKIQQQYGLRSINLVKPGVGETTRVLLRRVPWKILVRQADSPDHAHIRLLAADRGVPVEVVADLPYACLGLIAPMESDQ